MTKQLLVHAIVKFLLGILLVGILVFLPAGTLCYWNGWLLMGILFIPMFFIGIVMMIKSPELLQKRLQVKETQKEQIAVVKLSGLMFIVGFLIAGFDFRFDWNPLPQSVSLVAGGVFFVFYLLYAEVLRENAYLSRTVEIQGNQKVVDTGLYHVVRHPMYAVTMVMFFMIPLILGSLFSLIIFLFYPFFIAKRIQNEEQLLETELEGYRTYKQKVKYRLIPFVW